jgi:cyclopropane fatty-acyl-phospholipid synthase-like methyltransferase
MSERFDADYFLRGKELGISGYTDYRWLPNLTIPMAQSIAAHLGLVLEGTISGSTVLDFGCARGYLVKALRSIGCRAYGYDTSAWAIENADLGVVHYVTKLEDMAFCREYDWVIAKDVLEHVGYGAADPLDELLRVVAKLVLVAKRGIFVVVPLGVEDETGRSTYHIDEYEGDVTHVHRFPLWDWATMFTLPGWSVEARYRLPGVKDNYAKYRCGNGFITARRIEG